jgi:hypothetical protein
MLPSRKIAASFVAVFLIGALVGGLATWDFSGRRLSRFMTNTTDPKSMAERINQKYASTYQLTPDQQAKIAPLTQAMAQELYHERQQFATDVIKTLDTYHAKIAVEMPPEQRDTYEKANQERKQWMNKALLFDQASSDPTQK